MARTEAETAAKKRADRNKRYAKKFYLRDGCALYDALAIVQAFKCGACGRPFSDFTVSMNMDHEHFKILHARTPSGAWRAWTTVRGQQFQAISTTQRVAIESVKRRATPHSIRGLLCPGRYTGCNRLMGRIDRPDWLRKVIHYLENPPAKELVLETLA